MEALMARRARKRESGPWHEDKRFVSLVTDDGKRHSYLNAAIPKRREASPAGGGVETSDPIAPIESAICARCGFGYSHLMRNPAGACNECRIEYMAALAAEFEEAGINLGWGKCQRQQSREEPIDRRDDQSMELLRRTGVRAAQTVPMHANA